MKITRIYVFAGLVFLMPLNSCRNEEREELYQKPFYYIAPQENAAKTDSSGSTKETGPLEPDPPKDRDNWKLNISISSYE